MSHTARNLYSVSSELCCPSGDGAVTLASITKICCCFFLTNEKSKSNLHYIRSITSKRVTSGGTPSRPGQYSSEKTSWRLRAVCDIVTLSTCPMYVGFRPTCCRGLDVIITCLNYDMKNLIVMQKAHIDWTCG